MIQDIITDINSTGYFALFIIITLGMMIGRLKIKGFSFDISAVIFVALILGHFGFVVPKVFLNFGLLLFIFTIGIQAGPGFFGAFKKYGRVLIITCVSFITIAALTALILIKGFGVDMNLGVGIYTGALTSTPGLAAAIESTQSPQTPIGYGIAYAFGVIGVILAVNLLPKLFKVNLKNEEKEYLAGVEAEYPKVFGKNFVIENQNLEGKSLKELHLGNMTGTRLSRIMQGDKVITPNKDTVLRIGDIVRAVGTEEDLNKAGILLGKHTEQEIPLSQGYEIEWVLVTNKKIINKTFSEVALSATHNATIVKIRRAGIELTATPSSVFKFGDKLMISCDKEALPKVRQVLGNDTKKLSSTDFLPIVLGILLGILLGKVNIPLFGFSFNLGITGGTLIVGILLSRLGKTGPIIWTLSGSSNQLLRELGLLLFLATVGTDAGQNLVSTIQDQGFVLIGIGMIITVLPIIAGAILGRYVFKMNFLTLLGVLAGSMTSTPGLAIANSKSETEAAPIAYAAVYPVALVLKIITTKILANL